MHTCPFCGEECDCDWDDCGGLPVPVDCPHLCDELDERTEGEEEEEQEVYDEEAEFEYLGRIIEAHAQGGQVETEGDEPVCNTCWGRGTVRDGYDGEKPCPMCQDEEEGEA